MQTFIVEYQIGSQIAKAIIKCPKIENVRQIVKKQIKINSISQFKKTPIDKECAVYENALNKLFQAMDLVDNLKI